MKHAARLIPALLVAALAVYLLRQHDPKRPARPWSDNHVEKAK
jgi:hypothetical protein